MTAHHYWMSSDSSNVWAGEATEVDLRAGWRPVVVIDPEDYNQVDVLRNALKAHGWKPPAEGFGCRDALRSLLAPPRAEVPERGWGRNATVRDRKGVEWRQVNGRPVADGTWQRLNDLTQYVSWDRLDVAPDGILWTGIYDEAKS